MRAGGGHRLWLAALISLVGWMGGAGLPSVGAEEVSSAPELFPPLTLQLTIDEVLKRNPALQAAQQRAQAARHRIPQAKALNDPMVGADIEGIRAGDYMDIEYMVSQEWPFPGKRRLRGIIAAREAQMLQADADALERELVAQTKTAYFDLYLVERSIEINRRNRELLEQAERVAESKYAAGTSSMQDVLKAQVELAKLSNELIGLQQERTTAIARLNALMNRSPATPVVIATRAHTTQLLSTLDELERRLLDVRPELRAAALAVARSESELGLAKLDFLPDFTTRVEARQFRGGGGLREFDTMLAINVPIWFWGKQREHVKEVQASLASAKAAHQQAVNEALFALRDAYARLTAARQSVQLYETSVLPQAEQSLNVAQAGYEAERVEFLDLLDAERMWREQQLEYHRALAAFETAWADLEQAVGQPLEGVRESSAHYSEVTTP